jgi:hypothetical protein
MQCMTSGYAWPEVSAPYFDVRARHTPAGFEVNRHNRII